MPKLTGEAAAANKARTRPRADTPSGALATVTEELWTDDFPALEDTAEVVNVLWYGQEGTGKTTNLARAANQGNILVINVEGGLKLRALKSVGVDVGNIRVWPDPARGERLSFDGLVKIYNRLRRDLIADPRSWFAVGLDSYTEVHDAILEEAGTVRMGRIAIKAAKSGISVAEASTIDLWDTDRADYGRLGKQLRHVLRRLRDLPCHFLVTALESRTEDDDGSVRYGPLASNKASTDLLGYVDLVLACRPEDIKQPFRALTKKAGRYRAKDRFNLLPVVLAEPTFDRVHGYLTGELTAATDPLQKKVIQPKPPAQKAAAKSMAPEKEES